MERLDVRKCGWRLMWLVAFSTTAAAAAVNPCPVLSSQEQARLTNYVASKYEIPATVKLSLNSSLPVSDDCHKKLVFGGEGPLGEISLVLFLTPDSRFLTGELMDSRLDPTQERRERARRTISELEGDDVPHYGNSHAPISVVVFSDFECPFCKRTAEILRSDSLVVGGNTVRLVYRHYPLPQHLWAQKAAEVASCAGLQSAALFWNIHDVIFQHQSDINDANADTELINLASQAKGLNQEQLKECMKKDLSLGEVLRDKQLGTHLGVNQTPTVFINGEKVQVDSDIEFHKALLNKLSEEKKMSSGNQAKVAVF